MKRKLSYIFGTLIIAGSIVFPTAVVMAQDGASTSTDTTNTSTSGSDDTTQIETETQDMSQRIGKFKEHFNVKLSTLEEGHIKLRCVASQGRVGSLNSHFGDKVRSRDNLYKAIQTRLDNLVTKLKAKNVDTTTLESEITTLKTKINTFDTDKAAYLQALSDLKTVDCKADPTGFQAALDAARAAHDTLVTDAKDIRTYLTGTIKPTLVTIRQQLESASSGSTDNSTSGGTN